MPIKFEERLRLVEEHVLGVFMDARTSSTVLGVSREEMAPLAELAEAGALSLSDVGLDADGLSAIMRRRPPGWVDPEVEAVRIAYTVLAANRESVMSAVREHVPQARAPGV